MLFLLLSAIIISYVSGNLFLKVLRKKNIIQPIYEEAPTIHALKSGTPTMGGITFILPIIILSVIYFLNDFSIETLSLFTVLIGSFLIGFQDDFLKVTKKQNDFGFTPKQKLILQFSTAFISVGLLYVANFSSVISIFDFDVDFGIFYFIMMAVIMVGFSNASNLTDGLDGLLTSVSIVIFSTLFIISIYQGEPIGLSIFILIFTGLLIGFLLNNKFPAKMFMGDTGSLVIGALFTFLIIIMKIEFIGLFLGGIYIVEMLSVIFQVGYYKYTKKKYGEPKRLFRMAPLHHHFEQGGKSEKNITLNFVFVQVLISMIILVLL